MNCINKEELEISCTSGQMRVDVGVIVRGVSPLQPLEPVTKPVSKLVGNWLSTLKD